MLELVDVVLEQYQAAAPSSHPWMRQHAEDRDREPLDVYDASPATAMGTFWARRSTDAIQEAAARSSLTGDAGDGQEVEVRFGEQLHTRVLAGARDGDRELCPKQVAAYVAKYSCKSSHEQITSRDSNPERWRDRGVPEQLVQMAAAAIRLSQRPDLRGLRGWVHMLGFRGTA